MKKIIAIVLLITMVLSFAGVAEAKENIEIHVSVHIYRFENIFPEVFFLY